VGVVSHESVKDGSGNSTEPKNLTEQKLGYVYNHGFLDHMSSWHSPRWRATFMYQLFNLLAFVFVLNRTNFMSFCRF